MKKELIDNLHKAYPLVFAMKVIPTVGDGWLGLINDLCFVLDSHISTLPEELQDQIHAVQIKEKFGKLRFYMNHETPYIDGAIALAELSSGHTCELCGRNGKVQNFSGWYRCLCEDDAKKELERKEKKK